MDQSFFTDEHDMELEQAKGKELYIITITFINLRKRVEERSMEMTRSTIGLSEKIVRF